MDDKQIEFKLKGMVSIDDFATAAVAFKELIIAFTDEVDPTARVTWVLSTASGGSFSSAFHGVAENPGSEQALESALDYYTSFAQDAGRGEPLDQYSPFIRRPYGRLTGLINGSIPAIELVDRKGIRVKISRPYVETPQTDDDPLVVTPEPPQNYLRGSLRGKVTLMSFKGRDYFTLSQPHDAGEVCCYLADSDYADSIEQYSRQWVMVEGSITRDTYSGAPKAIRNITRIVPFPLFDSDALERAIGSLPGDHPGHPEDPAEGDREAHG